MAKRRTLNRLSKRYSRHRLSNSGSGYLDPDTSDINEGQTSWWNNLEDDTLPSMRNDRNETRQLSFNSQLDSISSSKEWWKYLRSSDDAHNSLTTSLRQNFSAAIVKTNVLETSTSESEKGLDLKKRKIPLRTTTRRSNSNNFLNVLHSDTDVTIPLKWRMKQAGYSALHDNPDRDVSQRELDKNEEDSLNLSSSVNILKLKPSIFKKKKIGDMEEQNAFQDILTQDDILDDNARMSEKDSSMQEDIENNPRKGKKMSHILQLENNEPGPSNFSIANAMSENNTASDTMAQSSDESNVKTYNHKFLKLKSHFLQHARKSIGNDAFKDALTDDRDTSLFRHNPNQEINPHDTESSTKSSLDISTRSVNRSKNKIDIRKSVITSSPLRRSPRASVNASKKQFQIDVPVQQHRDDIEGSSTNSSLDNDESRRKILASLKLKSRFLRRDSSLIKNPFEEVLQENENSTIKSNTAAPIEDNRTSVERNEIATGIMQEHGSLATKHQLSSAHSSTREENSDISLVVTSSDNEEAVSHQLTQPGSENELSKDNNIENVSKSVSENIIFETSEKQISSSHKATRDVSMISGERTRTDAISPTSEIKAYQVISDNDLHNDANAEQDLSTSKQLSKLSPGKETRLTRSSSRNQSETSRLPNKGASEIMNNANLPDDATRERSSTTLVKRLSKLSPDKEIRLTRNSLRNLLETSTSKRAHRIMSDNSSDDANKKQNPGMLSKLSPVKETRLTRNSLRNRLETSTSKRARRIMSDDSSDDANEKQNPGVLSKLSPVEETRLTRNSLRNQLAISTNEGAREVRSDDDSSDDANEKQDSGVLSKLSPTKENRLIHNSLRNRSETPKLSKDMELPKQSSDRDNDEGSDEISVGTETDIGDFSQIISSTRIFDIKANENATADKNVIPSVETETVDDENLGLATQIIQQNSSKDKTNIETVNLRSSLILQNLNGTSIKENRQTSRQKSSSGFQNRYSASIKTLSKDISKINSSKIPRTIDEFFKIKRPMTDKQSTSNDRNLAPSQVFNAEKIEKVKTELEKIKNREMAAMRIDGVTGKKDFALKSVDTALKQATKKKKLFANPTKVVDKAYLVNGKVYKAPKLPRPKYWATDRLYKFLWKCMEPKYKLATRVRSEKFMHELAQVVSLTQRRKKYESYKDELNALIQEMARLKIIKTHNDFYNFCQDFLPYEFRVKVVPMLLPGNKRTIPYDPEKLHLPLLDTLHSD